MAKPEKSPVALKMWLPPCVSSAGRVNGAVISDVAKRRQGCTGWLETEWLEGGIREGRRPVLGKDGVHVREKKGRRAAETGVRAIIVARKRRNGRGAKGGRKVEA
jgi:hypothetical protein